MAIQVLPREETFASKSGAALGQGLQALITAKMGQLRKQAGLSELVGPERAKSLSHLPDSMLNVLLRSGNSQALRGLGAFSGKNVPNKLANNKSKSLKKLDLDTAKIILQSANGDKKVARKIAQQLGYTL